MHQEGWTRDAGVEWGGCGGLERFWPAKGMEVACCGAVDVACTGYEGFCMALPNTAGPAARACTGDGVVADARRRSALWDREADRQRGEELLTSGFGWVEACKERLELPGRRLSWATTTDDRMGGG